MELEQKYIALCHSLNLALTDFEMAVNADFKCTSNNRGTKLFGINELFGRSESIKSYLQIRNV